MEAPLNSSMVKAYSVQRISCASLTPVRRYSSRSIGRTTGSRKVRSRLNTVAMNTPSGLVIARNTARNTKICIQPLVVISEFLRPQQGIQQVDHQPCTYNQHDDRFSVHIDLPLAIVLSEFDRRIAHNPAIGGRTLSLRLQRSRLACNLFKYGLITRHAQNFTGTARLRSISLLP